MSAEYRIVRDRFAGFEVQVRRWWWPFWVEANFCNTHSTLERAERWAEQRAAGSINRSRRSGFVKYLGHYEPATQAKRDNGT